MAKPAAGAASLLSTRCVTPVLVSNVSSDVCNAHGTLESPVSFNCTIPRISTRDPLPPVLVYDSVTEDSWPDETVKSLAVPIVPPLALTNEMLPVQDAAVPLDELGARLATLICAVSVEAKPTGGKLTCCVKVAVVETGCA